VNCKDLRIAIVIGNHLTETSHEGSCATKGIVAYIQKTAHASHRGHGSPITTLFTRILANQMHEPSIRAPSMRATIIRSARESLDTLDRPGERFSPTHPALARSAPAATAARDGATAQQSSSLWNLPFCQSFASDEIIPTNSQHN